MLLPPPGAYAIATGDGALAFGHGHIGLTTAAATGRAIADLAAGRPTAFDLASFRPDRF